MNDMTHHSESHRIATYEIDRNYRATLATLCNLMQDAAANHCFKTGISIPHLNRIGHTWVITKQSIRIEGFPVWADEVTVETWCKEAGGFTAVRDFALTLAKSDQTPGLVGTALVNASSAWLVLDSETGKPARLAQFADRLFPDGTKSALDAEFRKLIVPEESTGEWPFTATEADADMNGHVTNVRYVDWIMHGVSAERMGTMLPTAIDTQFAQAAFPGENLRCVTFERGSECWHRIIRDGDGAELFRARTEWKPLPPGPAYRLIG
jgi:acyl-ACP thioesterase